MKNYTLLIFTIVLFTPIVVNAQNTNYDSLSIDKKFDRLKFQVDSLSKVVSNQANTINKLGQLQISDSLQKKIIKSEKGIMIVRHNLYSMHKQNQVANGFTVAGVTSASVGFIMLIIASGEDIVPINIAGIILSLGGSFMTTVIAPIIRADSNKFLKRAGKKYKVEKE